MSASKGKILLKQMDGPKAKENEDDPVKEPEEEEDEVKNEIDLGILKNLPDEVKPIDENWAPEKKLKEKKINFLV
jgi:hypothetical protein